MKSALVPEASDATRQRAVVICGDISIHRRLLSDAAAAAAGLTIIRCSEEDGAAFFHLQRSNASVLVLRQSFIEKLPEDTVVQITNFGRGKYVLVVLESDAVNSGPAGKVLRLGCRGVLPHRFSSKLFRRAVLAVLKGEIWAPGGLISDLLADLLRASSLQTRNGLTPQEARIRELSLQGYKNSAIADALFISMDTVRWHKRRLNRKLRGSESARLPQTKAVPRPPEAATG